MGIYEEEVGCDGGLRSGSYITNMLKCDYDCFITECQILTVKIGLKRKKT